MTASNIQITAGSGTRLATNSYSEGGQTVHDEKFIPGEYPYASYVASANQVSAATTGDDLMQLMAGSSLNLFVRRIEVRQHAAASAVSTLLLQIVRLSTAGTGGTSVTPRRLYGSDAAAGATAMTLPTAQGTAGDIIWQQSVWVGTAALPVRETWQWVQLPNSKPIIVPAGTSNGIALNIVAGVTSLTCTVDIEFTEANFIS